MSNFDLLQQQILETLTQLKSFGAEIDMDEFNLLSASKSDEDDEDADADDILLLTESVNAIRGKQEKQVRIQNRRKTKEEDIEEFNKVCQELIESFTSYKNGESK